MSEDNIFAECTTEADGEASALIICALGSVIVNRLERWYDKNTSYVEMELFCVAAVFIDHNVVVMVYIYKFEFVLTRSKYG